MKRLLSSRAGLCVACVSLAGLAGCGPLPNTGLEVSVTPPSRFTPGTDFNRLYVDVTTEDGAQQSVNITISAATKVPYDVVFLMNGEKHSSANVQAYLYLDQDTQVAGETLDDQTVTQNKINTVTINLSSD